MEITRQLIALWAVVVISWNPVARAVEPPSPTPAPRPGTLASVALTRSLIRCPGTDPSSPIVITDDNLAELAEGAVVTMVSSTVAEFPEIAVETGVAPKTRERWRRKVFAQSKVIARAEAARDVARAEIDRLGRGQLDSRTLDRIAKAEAKLRTADDEIKRAKAELSKIVREARKEGAQPGWFR